MRAFDDDAQLPGSAYLRPSSYHVRVASIRRPAKYGPFHRHHRTREENERIVSSGEIWGRPSGNFYAGDFPAVKAWDGALPEGIFGLEFYTDVEPDPTGSRPGWPEWSEGRPGVVTIERKQLVKIQVVISRRRDPR